MIECHSVFDIAHGGNYEGRPLLIAGAGPGWSLVDWPEIRRITDLNIFALNHTITELWTEPGTWWVSNDHDRTFQSTHCRSVVVPRLKQYSPWMTVTQRKFIPGRLGDHRWVDHRGRWNDPMKWRLPAPDGSFIAYYSSLPNDTDEDDLIHNGHSVLELALEVATLWRFDPIVLVGCDMTMNSPDEYYAEPFRYKATPRRIVQGKLSQSRDSVVKNRNRWSSHIYIVSDLWRDAPFLRESAAQVPRILRGICSWSRT